MKAYTDLEQSEKLARILPFDSADMYYWCGDGEDLRIGGYRAMDEDYDIPCWSLVALLAAIPIEHNLHGYLTENGMVYRVETLYAGNSKSYSNPIDACVAMIMKLYELKML